MCAERAILPPRPPCRLCSVLQLEARVLGSQSTHVLRPCRFRNAIDRRPALLHTARALSGTGSGLKSEAERFIEGIDLDGGSQPSELETAALPVDDVLAKAQQRVAELQAQVRLSELVANTAFVACPGPSQLL